IDNYPEDKSEQVEIENNPQKEGCGTHTITFGKELYIEQDDFSLDPPPKYFRLKPDGMVRLKGAYIIKYNGVEKEGDKVVCVHCDLIEDSKQGGVNAGMKVKGTIHWVNAKTCKDVVINEYSSLILDGEGDFSNRLNPDSLIKVNGKAEEFLLSAKVGERFQFLRKGYYVKEAEDRFGSIVALKDSYKPQN
ncbi:MAG: glutamine--tRNA ligase, partial [Christensenellales bacterium]